jgi:ABC-type cobalamin/Fe3+-siderophores transport system ATPase subunit
MRLARSNDVWRALYKETKFPITGLIIGFRDVVGLGTGATKFEHPMSLICGENGVGKSTLLRLIYRALTQERFRDGEPSRNYAMGAMTGAIDDLRLRIQDGETSSEIQRAEIVEKNKADPEWLGVTFLETASIVPHLQKLYVKDLNRTDLLEGVTAKVLGGEELADIRQLVGRDYSKVEMFEIAEYAGFERVPYFKVSEGDTSYGSESMGTGELALLHLFWQISSIEEDSVLLLEEPESFVAPRSQRLFIDWLASVALRKKLFVIVSSHSGQIAERFPSSPTLLCTRNKGRVVMEPKPPAYLLADRLGILSHRRTIALVEDEAAAALAKSILQELEPKVFTECVFVEAGSNGDIVNAINNFPLFDSDRAVLLGVFDGDQEEQKIQWPTLRLPGAEGPEALLRTYCSNGDPARISGALGCERPRWEAALGGAAGIDAHDWITRMVGELRIDTEIFFARLMPLLIEDSPADFRRFAAEFAAKVRRR